MTDRDADRFREFADAQNGLYTAMDYLETARRALKRAKSDAPIQIHGEIDGLHSQIGELKTRVSNENPGYVMGQAGAKHQLQTDGQDQHEHRPGGGQ